MTLKLISAVAGALVILAQPASAAPALAPQAAAGKSVSDDGKPWPEAQFEIFKLAPGKQEAFIRFIAEADIIAAAGGQPPTQLYFHEDGADWDVLLFKPGGDPRLTPAQQAAEDAKARELHMETGPAYFTRIRSMIASHTDTMSYGPLSAAQWLARLDDWRKANPDAAKEQAGK